MSTIRCDRAHAWSALGLHHEAAGKGFDLRDAFANDADRFARFSQRAPHFFADLSKSLIDDRTQALLLGLAREVALESRRDAMFPGEAINHTEDRAVMHFLLRKPAESHAQSPSGATKKEAIKISDVLSQVHSTLDAMLAYADQVRGDHTITDVVNIGIGGSDLGPQMAVLALDQFVQPGKRFHFVSNVDGHELEPFRIDRPHT